MSNQLTEWKRITVTLSRAEWEKLRDAAQKDMRNAREQARYIIGSTLNQKPDLTENGKIVFHLDADNVGLAVYEFAMKLSKHPSSQIDEIVDLVETYFKDETDGWFGNPFPLFSKKSIDAAMSDEVKPLFESPLFRKESND